MRAGILLGAGFASLMRVFDPNQPFFSKIPVSFTIASLCSFFILFSSQAIRFREKYNLFAWIAGFGIAPGFIIGYAAALILGEVPLPTGVFDRLFIAMPLTEMIGSFSALGIGMPPLELWISGISLAIIAYILAFGDILVLETMIEDCNKTRTDEKIIFEVPRNHLITSMRNIFQGFIVPFLPLCGPQWTGGQALVVNRFKHSTPAQQPSYWGGAASLFWGMSLAMIFHPLVQLILPGKLIGFGLTLLIQGYLCVYLAFSICTTNVQRGIAGVMGAALVSANYVNIWDNPFWSGPTMALVVGTILYFTLEHDFSKRQPENTSEA